MASICSMLQSPRAANAFSKAWAARTCPAPDEADRRSTRGLVVICGVGSCAEASCRLALACRQSFQHALPQFLQLSEAAQILLKIMVQRLGLLRAELRPQNHVPQPDGMRKHGLFLQLFERDRGVIMIHGRPPAAGYTDSIVRANFGRTNGTGCERSGIRQRRAGTRTAQFSRRCRFFRSTWVPPARPAPDTGCSRRLPG